MIEQANGQSSNRPKFSIIDKNYIYHIQVTLYLMNLIFHLILEKVKYDFKS